jgi:hypothetical protein
VAFPFETCAVRNKLRIGLQIRQDPADADEEKLLVGLPSLE